MAQMDQQTQAEALLRIGSLPFNQVLQAEESYWAQMVSQLSDELLSLESCISLEEGGNGGTGPQDLGNTIATTPAFAFPELLKVPIGGIDENTDQFQFCWPQCGDVDPSIFANGVRVVKITFLANYDMRGIQLKLSNGLLSPIFQQAWPNKDDHNDPNRTNRIIHTDVKEGEILKATVKAYRHEYPFMKKFLLTGVDDQVIADVESRDDYGAAWTVDVPRGHTFVGIYGRFGYVVGYTGINGLGLLMYKK